MKKEYKQIYEGIIRGRICRKSLVLLLLIVFVGNGLLLSACEPVHPQIQFFARGLVKQVGKQVCKDLKHNPDDTCGNRDVRFDADAGLKVYINVYGVVDEKEMRSLVDFAKAFRGEEYKAIPIVMTFYATLRKPNTLISPKVVYVTTLKGEK